MRFVIRTASESDFDAVLALWRSAGSPPSPSDSHGGLASLLASDPGALLLAGSDDSVIGSLIAAWDGWRGSFYRLAVHPDHRRLGIGTALLQAGERRLLDCGAVRLTAIVAADDSRAMGFWQAGEFELQEHRARFVKRAHWARMPTLSEDG